jgi:glycerol-3-phosphate acyltransferase PlsY
MVWYALLAVAGYLVGSVPFGLYVARYSHRRSGLPSGRASANVGPLDLYRRSRTDRRLAGIAFLLELVKGFLPTFTGYLALGTPGAVSGGRRRSSVTTSPSLAGCAGPTRSRRCLGCCSRFIL